MSAHGFVYAFHYRNKGVQLLKVGMTASNDACWGRIKDYIREHNLPANNWEFVGFVECREALALEQRLHRRLAPFKATQGSARELFPLLAPCLREHA
jgi:hypothetical protein